MYIFCGRRALSAIESGTIADSAAVVNLQFTNIVGAPAGSADLQLNTRLLNSGQMARADMALSAPGYPPNQANINLMGMATTGIEYILLRCLQIDADAAVHIPAIHPNRRQHVVGQIAEVVDVGTRAIGVVIEQIIHSKAQ